MKTPIFAVFAVAVYRHLCMGVFTSLKEAERCAVEASFVENDAHHSFQIYQFALGESYVYRTSFSDEDSYAQLRACKEPPPLKTYVRSRKWDPATQKMIDGPWVWEEGGDRCCSAHWAI